MQNWGSLHPPTPPPPKKKNHTQATWADIAVICGFNCHRRHIVSHTSLQRCLKMKCCVKGAVKMSVEINHTYPWSVVTFLTGSPVRKDDFRAEIVQSDLKVNPSHMKRDWRKAQRGWITEQLVWWWWWDGFGCLLDDWCVCVHMSVCVCVLAQMELRLCEW